MTANGYTGNPPGGGGGDVTSVAGRTGAVVLGQSDITGLTAALADRATDTELTDGLATKAASSHTHAQADVTSLTADLALKAPLASPALTGNPTAPTQTAGNNTTRLATTAFVTTAVAGGGGGGAAMVVKRAIVSSGNITPQNTSGTWAALTGGPTLTIAAAVGDYISLEIMGVLMTTSSSTFYDLAVLAGASLVRFGSSGTGTPATEGDPAFYPDATFPRSGTVFDFVAEAGDIDAGDVTVCWAVKSGGFGALHAGFYPLRWRIINHGAVTVS